jgi:hypothetical protein
MFVLQDLRYWRLVLAIWVVLAFFFLLVRLLRRRR